MVVIAVLALAAPADAEIPQQGGKADDGKDAKATIEQTSELERHGKSPKGKAAER